MKNVVLLFALLSVIYVTVFAQTDARRIERLSGLAKVWGAVKYFHPFPA